MALVWNKRRKRLEGDYRDVKIEFNVVYQGDIGGGPYGHGVTPGIFTCLWTGMVDGDGEPLFQHVDDPTIVRTMRTATWFDRLDNIEEGRG